MAAAQHSAWRRQSCTATCRTVATVTQRAQRALGRLHPVAVPDRERSQRSCVQGVGLGRRARSLCDQTGYAKARGFGHNFTSPARELRVSRKAAANSHVTGTLESRLDLYVHLARICLPRHRNLRVATQLPAAAAPPSGQIGSPRRDSTMPEVGSAADSGH